MPPNASEILEVALGDYGITLAKPTAIALPVSPEDSEEEN